jgi:hypothetical protein
LSAKKSIIFLHKNLYHFILILWSYCENVGKNRFFNPSEQTATSNKQKAKRNIIANESLTTA